METFSALLTICAGNSPVPGEFPTQRPVTRSFDVYFDMRPNKRLSKQSCGWWFETLSHPFWRHRNEYRIRAWTSNYIHGFLWKAITCLSTCLATGFNWWTGIYIPRFYLDAMMCQCPKLNVALLIPLSNKWSKAIKSVVLNSIQRNVQ